MWHSHAQRHRNIQFLVSHSRLADLKLRFYLWPCKACMWDKRRAIASGYRRSTKSRVVQESRADPTKKTPRKGETPVSFCRSPSSPTNQRLSLPTVLLLPVRCRRKNCHTSWTGVDSSYTEGSPTMSCGSSAKVKVEANNDE